MRSTRPLTAIVLLAALLAAAGSAPSAWLGLLGPEGTGGSEADYPADVQQRSSAAQERSRNKAEVVRRLLQGELSVFEAAAWFRFLNESGPYPHDYRGQSPGGNDEEKACRQVLRWSRACAPELGPEAERRVGQLEQELSRHLSEYGRVVLPSPEALPEPQ